MKKLFRSYKLVVLCSCALALVICAILLLISLCGGKAALDPRDMAEAAAALSELRDREALLSSVCAACAIAGAVVSAVCSVVLLTGFKKKIKAPVERLSLKSPKDFVYPEWLAATARELCELRDGDTKRANSQKTLGSYISHEVKNSLNVLTALVQLDESKADVLAYIKQICESMEDILILCEMGKDAGRGATTDLSLVCAEVVDSYRKTFPDITFDFPENAECVVQGRDNPYRRAAANLIENAVKYGGGGIRVTLYKNAGCVVLRVADNGAGIPESGFERLFDANYRASTPDSVSHGIGLNLVSSVARLNGGSVWARNAKGGGAEFYMSLPSAGRAA